MNQLKTTVRRQGDAHGRSIDFFGVTVEGAARRFAETYWDTYTAGCPKPTLHLVVERDYGEVSGRWVVTVSQETRTVVSGMRGDE